MLRLSKWADTVTELGRLRIGATLENLAVAAEFVRRRADRFGLGAEKRAGLAVAFEEAFVNVCNYAFPGGGGEVELVCGTEGDAFVVELADEGVAFDVAAVPAPDTTADIMDRPEGGLGILFIRRFSDGMRYRRDEGRNVLHLIVRKDYGGDG